MASETGTQAYCPLIIGVWQWKDTIGTAGGWAFELSHPLLITGPHDAGIAVLLPAGHELHYQTSHPQPTVITGSHWVPAPPPDVVEEMQLTEEVTENLRAEAAALRDAILPALPF